jgi:hypothetical protein
MGIIGCLPDNVQQVICMFLLSVALSWTYVATFCIRMCCNIINGNFWPLVTNLISLGCCCFVRFLISRLFSYLNLSNFFRMSSYFHRVLDRVSFLSRPDQRRRKGESD